MTFGTLSDLTVLTIFSSFPDKPKVYQGVRVKTTVKELLQKRRALQAAESRVRAVFFFKEQEACRLSHVNQCLISS